MPTPVAPAPPEGSSSAVPAGGFKAYFKRITDWIASMSPAGAADYETDWVACSNTGSPALFNATGFYVKRIGKIVYVRGNIVPLGGGTLTSTVVSIAQLPAGFIPTTGMLYPWPGGTTTASAPVFLILTTGVIQVRAFVGAPATYSTNSTFAPAGGWSVS